MVELVKEARKRSEDPVQEALRQNKDTWNHDASLLIAQLIAFKKGLNGRGEPKVGIPPGSIKDPMPHEVGSYLDQLADRYSKLISDAKAIIDEQNNYSETRRKPQEHTASVFDEELIKIASWWGSRALTYTKNLFSSKEAVKARIAMIKTSVDLIKQLKVIDNFIVSKKINAIPNAVYDFDKFISSFNKLILPNMKKLSKLDKEDEKIQDNKLPSEQIISPGREDETPLQLVPDAEHTTEELSEPNIELSGKKSIQSLTAKNILEDIVYTGRLIQIMNLLNSNKSNVSLFESGIKELRKLLDNIEISSNGSIEDANNSYNDLKLLSSKILKITNNSFVNQFKDAEKLLISKAGTISVEFEKLAKNYLSRWLKRQKLKILPDSDDRIRLEASKKISNLIYLINKFQDLLEDNEPNIDVIKASFFAIGTELGELADDLYYLAKTHNDEYEQNRLNGKPMTHMIKLQTISRLQNMKKEFVKLPAELE